MSLFFKGVISVMTVFQDTNGFFNLLLNNYNIQMFEKQRTSNGVYYVGEGYSVRGEVFVLSVLIRVNTTEVKIFKVNPHNRTCVFQKNYSTVNDKHSLSKSVSILKFLDKALY